MFDYKVSKQKHFDEACRTFALRHNMAKLAERAGTSARSEWKLMFECCIKEEIILRENGNEKESYSGVAKAKSGKFN